MATPQGMHYIKNHKRITKSCPIDKVLYFFLGVTTERSVLTVSLFPFDTFCPFEISKIKNIYMGLVMTPLSLPSSLPFPLSMTK